MNRKKAGKINIKKGIKEKVSDMLEIPKEIILNLPLITITGNEYMSIENFKGIVEYSEDRIRINTSSGVIRIEGKNLVIKQITAEIVNVSGIINKFEYVM